VNLEKKLTRLVMRSYVILSFIGFVTLGYELHTTKAQLHDSLERSTYFRQGLHAANKRILHWGWMSNRHLTKYRIVVADHYCYRALKSKNLDVKYCKDSLHLMVDELIALVNQHYLFPSKKDDFVFERAGELLTRIRRENYKALFANVKKNRGTLLSHLKGLQKLQ